MKRFEAEIVVVGAGPAGAGVARLLAMAGRDVLLLDRAAFPRPKPCGDCLSAEAGALLARWGLLEAVEAERPARLAGWRIHSPRGAAFEARFRDVSGDAHRSTALALPRERLDAVLLGAALRAGARLEAPAAVAAPLAGGTGVAGRLAGGAPFEARARLVIAADGLRSVLVRRHGLRRRLARVRKVSLTAHLNGGVRGDATIGEMHVATGLCAGLAPVGIAEPGLPGAWNLTVVADADRFGREIAADAHAFVARSLDRFPALRGRVDPEAIAGAALLGSGPFDSPVRRVIADGLALTGDAAGYFDPFTGQGIHHALAAAELLAPVADAALARAGRTVRAVALTDYARARARLLRGTRSLQRLVDAVLRRPALADAAIARLGAAPAAARALLAVTGDMAPPAALISPRVLASFLVPSVARSS